MTATGSVGGSWHDASHREIARRKPASLAVLAGIGAAKLGRHGDALVDLVGEA